MKFELLPVLDKMVELYQHPATFERFKQYLKLLSGDTNNDLELPIGAYNPMGKEHVLHKIEHMRSLKTEQLAAEIIGELNKTITDLHGDDVFKVILCLSDDLKGGWTNRYTSDYDSKFKLNALVTRKFCTPIFWTGEEIYDSTILSRTAEYCCRTVCWLQHPKPETLEEHVLQESRVADMMKKIVICPGGPPEPVPHDIASFYEANKTSTNYLAIFNFLYGDEAAASLGYQPLGISEAFAGYKFATALAALPAKP